MVENAFHAAATKGNPPPSAAGMLTRHDMDTQGKMFLKAPKDIIEAIISSHIEDKDTAAAIAAFRLKCHRFHRDSPGAPLMQWIESVLAGWRSVNAAALLFALETNVGAISEIATTAVLGLKGGEDLAKRARDRRDKDKVEKGKVQD